MKDNATTFTSIVWINLLVRGHQYRRCECKLGEGSRCRQACGSLLPGQPRLFNGIDRFVVGPSSRGFSLWGFSDFHGDHDSNDLGLNRSFSEYRLSHGSAAKLFNTPGFSFQAELNSITGDGNDVVRAGLTYKHKLPLPWGKGTKGWLQWRAFPYETDNDGGQASLIFFLPISPRLQIKGFADYNVMEGANNRWVVEPELNIQISRRLAALLEFRYNEFEDANPAIHGSGVALGIRYQFNP